MPSESTEGHRREARERPPARVAVITLSDTRTPESDESGRIIREMLGTAGHKVVHYAVMRDEPDELAASIRGLAATGNCDVILTNGGTGIAPRDGTYEAVSQLIERPLPGFGELFRMLSWHEVGAAAMLSRAAAGLIGTTLVFAMPGSRNAVRLAMEQLIVPELAHLVWEMRK
ncbi:MogA/MoaB family molybdenum cofactor biosynthesis protein [bacterium]|nr:MogA/MoaB family molybdenum cofactor biosynthesis protein [bacterium]